MARASLSPFLLALLFFVACGSAQAPAPPPRETAGPPLPRSSIAAILEHRDELKLTDEQVHGLQDLDNKLADNNGSITTEFGSRPDAGPAPPPPPIGKGIHMGGAGSGGMSAGAGAGPGQKKPGLVGGVHDFSHKRQAPSVQDRQDDNDTRFYLRAEQEILTEEQREPAREFAEAYREALYDRRQREGR
jgi:hypothetical protein